MKKIVLGAIFTFGVIGFVLAQPAFKVDTDGEVGVGLNDPQRSLHVQTNNGVFRLDRDANGPGFILAQFANGAGFGGNAVNSYFVGAAIRSGNDVFEINDLNGAVSGGGARRVLIDDDGGMVVGGATVNTAFGLYVEAGGGTALKTDGDANWSIPSDKRLKQNINDYTDGLNIIKQLRPVSYEYNGKAGTMKGSQKIGVIAQDLQKVAPFMVENLSYQAEEGLAYIDDEPGARNVKTVNEEYLGVNTSSLQWILVNAINEQQGIIDQKDKEIKELQERISTIEKTLVALSNTEINQSSVSLQLTDQGALAQNRPNPFRDNSTIDYQIPNDAQAASINIFDINGKLLRNVEINHIGKGQLDINAENIPSGTYSYQLVVDNVIVDTKKMVLQK